MLDASQPDDEQTNTKVARFNLNQGYLEGDKCDNNETPWHLETISRLY